MSMCGERIGNRVDGRGMDRSGVTARAPAPGESPPASGWRSAGGRLAAAATLALAACGGGGDGGARAPVETIEDAPYFPLAPGDRRAYCVEGVWASDIGCDPANPDCPGRSFGVNVETVGGTVVRAGRVARVLRIDYSNGEAAEAVYWASDRGVDYLSGEGVGTDFQALFRLPFVTGDTYDSLVLRDADAGEDIDRDGRNERYDATETVHVAGAATVDTPAGRFNVVDVETLWDETLRYSGGGGQHATRDRLDSYDEAIGLVRSSSRDDFSGENFYVDVWLLAYEVGRWRSALGVDEATAAHCEAALLAQPAAAAARERAAASPRGDVTPAKRDAHAFHGFRQQGLPGAAFRRNVAPKPADASGR